MWYFNIYLIRMKGIITKFRRRDFLKALSGVLFYDVFASPLKTTYSTNMKIQQYDMQLRPHHIIDIITGHGKNIQYEPHPYGHSQYLVAPRLLSDLDLKIRLVIGADDICAGCTHLMDDRLCKDVLAQLKPAPSKQAYNDLLDSSLFDYFNLDPNCIISTREFLILVNDKIPGIEKICTHPKEDPEERLLGLINGLVSLGIRDAV